jgi:hypothetical protein
MNEVVDEVVLREVEVVEVVEVEVGEEGMACQYQNQSAMRGRTRGVRIPPLPRRKWTMRWRMKNTRMKRRLKLRMRRQLKS